MQIGLTGFAAGGIASDTTIDSGGLELVNSGGTELGASVSGNLQVYSGGLASGTEVMSGGLLHVGVPGFGRGGRVSDTTIDSGGFEFVNSGGTDLGASVSGTLRVLSRGLASGMEVHSGGMLLGAGGIVSGATIESGGLEVVNSGGTDLGASVSGTLRVFSSGLASGVEVHSGGLLRVGALGFGAGGLVSGTTIDSGGLELVDLGGTDFSATINASAALVVFSRGTALDTTISGGTLVVSSGGSLGGKVTFAGSGGTLLIGGTAMPAAVISGFTTSDTIDLTDVPFGGQYAFAVLVSGSNKQTVLNIVENKKTYSLNLSLVQSPRDMKGVSFQLSSDGSTGTDIRVVSGGSAGFDIGSFPGLNVMSSLWSNTNLSWAGYCLSAPEHSSKFTPWVGHWKKLTSGTYGNWNLLPIFVGRQNDSLTPVTAANALALASSDTTSALNQLSADKVPGGTVIYLDIEPNANLTAAELTYISGWCTGVSSSSAGYVAGVYCLPGQALKIAKYLPGTPFWITRTIVSPKDPTPLFTVPNGGVILPMPNPSKSGYAAAVGWQYLINTYSFLPNVGLSKADLDSFTSRGIAIAVVPHQPIANMTVDDGQFLDVPSDVAANNTLINAGGIENVYGSDIAAQITDGGYQYVWGTATGAIAYDPGVQIIAPGAFATGTVLSGGEQDVFGCASGTVVSAGLLVIESGGTADGAILSGGTEVISTGGEDDGAQILGGEQDVFGYASGATVFAGSQVVEAGGRASGTIVSGGGILALLSGGTAINFLIGSGGILEVGSGKMLSGFAVSSGATLDVLSAGSVKSTTILGGGNEILGTHAVDSAARINGGTLSVNSGGRTVGASAANGGSEVVSGGGTAISTIISGGGMLRIATDGFASSTRVLSGGTEIVGASATDKGAQISAGYQDVYGFAGSTTIRSGGTEVVEPGGTASASTVSSGGVVQLIGTSTIAGLTLLSGAALVVGSGYTLSNLTVKKGVIVDVLSGGTALGLRVAAGGTEIVADGGFDSGATISSGGVLEAIGSAVLSGDTFSKGAVFEFGSGFARPIDAHATRFVVLSGGIRQRRRGSVRHRGHRPSRRRGHWGDCEQRWRTNRVIRRHSQRIDNLERWHGTHRLGRH